VATPLPSGFLVDVLDVAAAAELWRRGQWEIQGWSSSVREGPMGISLPELAAGAGWVDDFLESFEYDDVIIEMLRSRDALAGVEDRFWSFLRGRRFEGCQRDFRIDGERFVGGPVSTIVGRLGDVLLFRAGVREILSYCISVASEADKLSAPVSHSVQVFDGASATSVGHGWSLLAASALWAAGRRPDWRFKLVLGGGDPEAAVRDLHAFLEKQSADKG
jgi:hypothetical protein